MRVRAQRQLQASHNFWAVTLWPDERPHAMPVSGRVDEETLLVHQRRPHRERSALDRGHRGRATPGRPKRRGEIRISREEIAHVLELVNAKYETDYRMDMMDPARTRRSAYDRWWAFGLDADDFTGSPTRWTFQ
jgi:hypothetical protein